MKMSKTKYLLLTLVLLIAGCGSCSKAQDNSAFIPQDSIPSAKDDSKGEWSEVEISEGLKYKSFRGYDETSGANQIVSVLDVDLNLPRYEVKFTYHNPGIVTSDVMKETGAVGVVNAAYELTSCYIKIDGDVMSAIPNGKVMDTGVPQWKSEAAVYTDGVRGVKIDFSAKACNRDVEATRAVYNRSTEANILSSAPMLIDNYETVGAHFVPDGYSQEQLETLNYEDPIRHQGVRHPRTAVALTSDNHFLMVVVDGRRSGISEGMNARELTFFLKTNFNPQYALNMDGGGSSTLCVEGQGDPDTHVVNYPTDNNVFDHSGERRVSTHICIIDTNKN